MQPCPRQTHEATMAVQLAHESHWDDEGRCSYCGSLSPALLFEAIARGDEIEPTDKDYKIYVRRPNPKAGQPRVLSALTWDPSPERIAAEGWVPADPAQLKDSGWFGEYKWMRVGPTAPMTHDKFYFQHLNAEEQRRFLDLLNAKRIRLGYPGRFYRLPFFIRVKSSQ